MKIILSRKGFDSVAGGVPVERLLTQYGPGLIIERGESPR
jgi:hypothetical protein